MFAPRPRRSFCLGLAALAASCASSKDAAEGGVSVPPGWIYGGQTGSLTPLCGLPDAARAQGVPEVADGFVLQSSECEGAPGVSGLTLRDPQGNAVPVDVSQLPGGAVFVTPVQPLLPGTYRVQRAGAGEAMLRVVEAQPLPTSLGTLRSVGGSCPPDRPPTFELVLDPAVLPYLGVLALQLRIDAGALLPYIDFGTLEVVDAMAAISPPASALAGLPDGTHTFEVTALLAGQESMLPSLQASFELRCPPPAAPAEEAAACGVSRPGERQGLAGWLTWLGSLALWKRRRARRRPRTAAARH
jgi:hypothetical protein